MKQQLPIRMTLAVFAMIMSVFSWSQITTFNYTGGMQTYVVPGGVTSISVDVRAASGGGSSGGAGFTPGNGGRIQSTMTVTPGSTLYIFVGGQGVSGVTGFYSAGGYNGGGNGGLGFGFYAGGGGGGASDIRVGGTGLANRAIVAGGGGGAAYNYFAGGDNGGNGGGLIGAQGLANFMPDPSAGKGGSQVAGGIAGYLGGYSSGSAGSLGQGGYGGVDGSGGGGGGGYYGGGGGAWAGAGGGSDWVNPGLFASTTSTPGYNSGNGQIIIEVLCDGLVDDVSATSVCEGEGVTLSAVSTNGGTVTWDGGVINGVEFFPALGLNTYTATSDNADDCDFTVDIMVNASPVVTLTASDYSICDGETVTFTPGGAGSYTFDPPGVMAGVPYTPPAYGPVTYTVYGIHPVTGCENEASVIVDYNPSPTVSITASETEICEGESVTFNYIGDADSYSWDPGDIMAGVPYFPSDDMSIFTVTGTFASSGCSTSASIGVTVNGTPTLSATSGDEVYCIGETVVLGAGGDADVVVWDPIDLEPGIGTHTYTATGTYAGGDCEATASVTIEVVALPTVTASVDFESLCMGNSVVFNGLGAATYSWDNGVVNGALFTPADMGIVTYTVVGTDANNCVGTASVDVEVVEEMEITYTTTPIIGGGDGEIDITVTGGAPAYSFDWNNDGTGDFDDTEDLTGLSSGGYIVVVISEALGCEAHEVIYVGNQSGIEDLANSIFSVYPNPTTEQVTISSEGNFTYQLTTVNGDVVGNGIGFNQTIVSMSELSSGVYFITLTANSIVNTVKIIKN